MLVVVGILEVVVVVWLMEVVLVIRLLIIWIIVILLVLRRKVLEIGKAEVVRGELLRVESKLVRLTGALPLIVEILLLVEKWKRILLICYLEANY